MAVCRVIRVLVIFSSIGVIFADAGPVAASAADVPLNFAEEIKALRTFLGTIKTRLLNLQTTVEHISTPGDLQRCHVQSVTEAIRGGDYSLAVEKLVDLKSDEMIPVIVQEVFANSSKNANTILAFAKAQKSAETKFLVMKSLLEEMRSHDQRDPLILISIVKEGHRQLRTNDKIVRAKTQALIKDAVKEMKTGAISKFENAMTSNTFKTDAEVAKLANVFRIDVFNEIMEEVVGKVLPVVGVKTVVENIGSLKNIQQIIPALSMVFNRVSGNWTTEDEFALASQIYSLQKRKNYESVDMFLKADVDEMMKQLSQHVKNLFVAKRVCLWNRGREMYLYARDVRSGYTFSTDIHLSSDEPGPAAAWIIEADAIDKVHFRNVLYDSQYLIEETKHSSFHERSVEKGSKGEKSRWYINCDDEYCIIYRTHYKNYLGASGEYEISEPFTYVTFADMSFDPYYQWELRNCDHIEA